MGREDYPLKSPLPRGTLEGSFDCAEEVCRVWNLPEAKCLIVRANLTPLSRPLSPTWAYAIRPYRTCPMRGEERDTSRAEEAAGGHEGLLLTTE